MKNSVVLCFMCVLISLLVCGCIQQSVHIPATAEPTPKADISIVTDSNASDSFSMLTNDKWMITSMVRNESPVELVSGTIITAQFTPDGNVNGKSGCNNYFASYHVSGDSMVIGPAGSTMMFCGEPFGTMDQESLYLDLLQNVSTYSITDADLTLLDATGKNQLNFQAYTPPSLLGSWKLDSIANGSSVSRIIAGSTIIVMFQENGNLNGTAGCNNYNAEYKAAGEVITISPIITTRMFCEQPEGLMSQESLYLSNLQNVTTYSFENDILTFRDDKGRANLFYMKE